MVATAQNEAIKEIIRSKLKCFINRREQAYKHSRQSGFPIPDLSSKARAIEALKIQLQASVRWNLDQTLNWIQAMHDDIVLLLPYEFHEDEKQQAYRKHMLDLLRYCHDLLNERKQTK